MSYRFLCDFDGTIAISDVTDLLLDTFADPTWREIEEQWKAGQIGSAACMARQVELLRCTHQALDDVLVDIEIDPGFADFVSFCHQHHASLTIVSDGLDYAIMGILEQAGIPDLPIIANHLVFRGDRRYSMESPYADPNCRSAAGTCKCKAASRSVDERPVVLIGDGRSDFCAAAVADFVLAKDALLAFCQDRQIPHAGFSNFSEIPDLLARHFPAGSGRKAGSGILIAAQ